MEIRRRTKGDVSLVFLSLADGNLCPFVRPSATCCRTTRRSSKKRSCLRA